MRVRYYKLDPNSPIDGTAYKKGHRWGCDTTHPTVPTIIGIRHLVGETGRTKEEAKKRLVGRVERIIAKHK